jgi:two-component system, response regulator RegA
MKHTSNQSVDTLPTSAGSVLIVDEHDSFLASIGHSFRKLGYEVWAEEDFETARLVVENDAPDLVVSELRVGRSSVFDLIPHAKQRNPNCRLVVATAYPSVATATRAVRLGVDAYLPKPVTAALIVEVLEQSTMVAHSDSGEDYCWPSLNRTMWEYLNQVFAVAGSMSEAARRLGVDRRSLRRMLAKYPPAR